MIDYKTYYRHVTYSADPRSKTQFETLLNDTVKQYGSVVYGWFVDTCQMWNSGLGEAFNRGGVSDVYWLIPGDFFYSQRPAVITPLGSAEATVTGRAPILDIPHAVQEDGYELCIGEISVDVNSSKQLIDTYGTYGLLYNWFPQEAQQMRKITDKPRSEFFAISGGFLEEMLRQRWYAYEQTIVILLHGILSKKRIQRVKLGDISDLPAGRDTLAAAMQQVERTERVLKMVWREQNEPKGGWIEKFRELDQQSGQVRGAALIILQNLLGSV